jgi:hypothetical protein
MNLKTLEKIKIPAKDGRTSSRPAETVVKFRVAKAAKGAILEAQTQTPPQEADYTIRIAPVSHEIAPGKLIKTTAYNGSIPGPALRLKEGKPVRINVTNDSGYPNLIHWHGLYVSSEQDGSTEEGSPIIAPGQLLTYAYTPKPGMANPCGCEKASVSCFACSTRAVTWAFPWRSLAIASASSHLTATPCLVKPQSGC